MTRLAVLSDLHANLTALSAVREDVARRGIDQVVVLGDLVGYLTRPNQVVAQIAALGWPALSGNYDLAVLTGGQAGADEYLKPGIGPIPYEVFAWTCRRVQAPTRRYLSSLPSQLKLNLAGRSLVMVHGSPNGVRDYVYPGHPAADLDRWLQQTGAQVLCMGHTHRPFIRRMLGGLVINPGSVGKPKDGDTRASYAIITMDRQIQAQIIRVPFDLQAEAHLLTENGLPPEVIARLRAGT